MMIHLQKSTSYDPPDSGDMCPHGRHSEPGMRCRKAEQVAISRSDSEANSVSSLDFERKNTLRETQSRGRSSPPRMSKALTSPKGTSRTSGMESQQTPQEAPREMQQISLLCSWDLGKARVENTCSWQSLVMDSKGSTENFLSDYM